MSQEIVEKQIKYVFGDSWRIFKYDEHPFYTGRLVPLAGKVKKKTVSTTGIDLAGSCGNRLFLVEIKDFAGFPRERARITSGELALEIAIKVRDSIAGLIAGAHHPNCKPHKTWEAVADHLCNAPHAIQIILWLEVDMLPPALKHKQMMSTFGNQLKQNIRNWLPASVFVLNLQTYESIIPDMEAFRLSMPG